MLGIITFLLQLAVTLVAQSVKMTYYSLTSLFLMPFYIMLFLNAILLFFSRYFQKEFYPYLLPVKKVIFVEFVFIILEFVYFISIESYEFSSSKKFYFSIKNSFDYGLCFFWSFLSLIAIYSVAVFNYFLIIRISKEIQEANEW